MPLPSSGPISMSDINIEIGRTSNNIISMSEAAVKQALQCTTGPVQFGVVGGPPRSIEIPVENSLYDFTTSNSTSFVVEQNPKNPYHIVAAWSYGSTYVYVKVGIINKDNDTIAWGTETQVTTQGTSSNIKIFFDAVADNEATLLWINGTTSGEIYGCRLSISGISITLLSTIKTFGISSANQLDAKAIPGRPYHFMFAARNNSTGTISWRYCRWSPSNWSVTVVVSTGAIESTTSDNANPRIVLSSPDRGLIFYYNTTGITMVDIKLTSSNDGTGGVVSATEITNAFNNSVLGVCHPEAAERINDAKVFFVYTKGSSIFATTIGVGVQGDSIFVGQEYELYSTTYAAKGVHVTIDPMDTSRFMMTYAAPTNYRITVETGKIDSDNFIYTNNTTVLGTGSNSSSHQSLWFPGSYTFATWFNDNISTGGAYRIKQIYGYVTGSTVVRNYSIARMFTSIIPGSSIETVDAANRYTDSTRTTLASAGSPNGAYMCRDGINHYYVSWSDKKIYHLTSTVPYNLGPSPVTVSSRSVTSPSGVYVSEDGKKMWEVQFSKITEYDLSIPFNIDPTNATSVLVISQPTTCLDITWSPDGSKMYAIINGTTEYIKTYQTQTPWTLVGAYEVSYTLDINRVNQLNGNPLVIESAYQGLAWNSNGRQLLIANPYNVSHLAISVNTPYLADTGNVTKIENLNFNNTLTLSGLSYHDTPSGGYLFGAGAVTTSYYRLTVKLTNEDWSSD